MKRHFGVYSASKGPVGGLAAGCRVTGYMSGPYTYIYIYIQYIQYDIFLVLIVKVFS